MKLPKEISAKSVNIPFSYNSYSPKPYAYVHFSSAAIKNLLWASPAPLITLALPGMSLLKCPLFVIVAVALVVILKNVPHHVHHNALLALGPAMTNCAKLYNKHLPPSHPAKRHNHFARPPSSHQRSYADAAGRRAPSRSRSPS
ncbi:unnamed protein product [Rhizophagus irregularis]|nr:unnamed protein product [Rhizophagus irregularis]